MPMGLSAASVEAVPFNIGLLALLQAIVSNPFCHFPSRRTNRILMHGLPTSRCLMPKMVLKEQCHCIHSIVRNGRLEIEDSRCSGQWKLLKI